MNRTNDEGKRDKENGVRLANQKGDEEIEAPTKKKNSDNPNLSKSKNMKEENESPTKRKRVEELTI